jgi:putative membrane protein
MRVLRSVATVLLFIAGVFIASANTQLVTLVYLPAVPALGLPAEFSIGVPLFLLILGTLVAGVLLGGLAAILEQARMRLGLRRARKERDLAVDEREKATALLDNAAEEAAGLRSELAELREELRAAGETQVAEEPLTAFSEDLGDEIEDPAHDGDEDVPSEDQADSAGSGAADDTVTKPAG